MEMSSKVDITIGDLLVKDLKFANTVSRVTLTFVFFKFRHLKAWRIGCNRNGRIIGTRTYFFKSIRYLICLILHIFDKVFYVLNLFHKIGLLIADIRDIVTHVRP